MLWIGGNDFGWNAVNIALGNFGFLDGMQANVDTVLTTLRGAGMDVVIFNLPDFSRVPTVTNLAPASLLPNFRVVSQDWNARLGGLALSYGAAVVDVFALFDDLTANAELLGVREPARPGAHHGMPVLRLLRRHSSFGAGPGFHHQRRHRGDERVLRPRRYHADHSPLGRRDRPAGGRAGTDYEPARRARALPAGRTPKTNSAASNNFLESFTVEPRLAVGRPTDEPGPGHTGNGAGR